LHLVNWFTTGWTGYRITRLEAGGVVPATIGAMIVAEAGNDVHCESVPLTVGAPPKYAAGQTAFPLIDVRRAVEEE
jgi:hypothetical protein